MAAGCCGTKKQKLNNSQSLLSSESSDGHSSTTSMTSNGPNGTVALPEMCFYCFDVLYSQLFNLEPPKTPTFNNDA